MRLNIENCAKNGTPIEKAWVLDELVENLKEMRDRTKTGDFSVIAEFFSVFTFNDAANF